MAHIQLSDISCLPARAPRTAVCYSPKTKLFMTSIWNIAALLFLQATHVSATVQVPHFESCNPSERGLFGPAIRDGSYLASISLATVNTALSMSCQLPSTAAQPLSPYWTACVADRSSQVRLPEWPILEYLLGSLTRMHDRFAISPTTYRCLKNST